MNHKALKSARTAINKNFGDMTDLSEELQNTIVNIYYKAAIIAQNSEQFVFRYGIEGMKKGVEDSLFYINSVKALPEIINRFREDVISKGNKRAIKFMT